MFRITIQEICQDLLAPSSREPFLLQNTLLVARRLIGCFLVRKLGEKTIHARILETEAYVGEDDLARHASRGRTQRTEVMYDQAGHAYVYLVYGMYDVFNVVTERRDSPAAVLIRAVAIEGVPRQKTDGPGKLTRFLKIGRRFNAHDLTRGEKLWIESPSLRVYSGEKIHVSKRIGIDYAKHCREHLWRFVLQSN